MGPADVNWLLSASVQSGAALVAIVGGLLGSRYVALDSERQAALRRLADAEARFSSARSDAAAIREAWSAFRVTDLLDADEVYTAVETQLRSGREARVDVVLEPAQLRDADVPLEELAAHLSLVTDEMQAAFERLSGLVPEREQLPVWDAFRREVRLDPGHDGVWEWVYNKVADGKEKAARQARLDRAAEERQRRRRAGGFVSDMPELAGAFSAISPRALSAASDGSHVESAGRLVRERDEADRASRRLETEVEAARVHLRDTSQPQGFSLAIQVLAYIAVTTIAFPLTVMVWTPFALPWWLRVAVAAAFMSGVAMLIRYLLVYAAVLRDPLPGAVLPPSLVGLLRRHRSPDGSARGSTAEAGD